MQDALDDIKRQGATNIIVRSVKPPDDSATGNKSWVSTYGLVKRDIDRFETFDDAIIRIVPMRVFPTEARYRDRFMVARVIGTVPEYADVNKFDMASGRFLAESDDRERKNVCVLGAEAADQLFPFEDPIGQSVAMQGPLLHRRRRHFRAHADGRQRRQSGGRGLQPRRLHPAQHQRGPLRRDHLHRSSGSRSRREGAVQPGDADRHATSTRSARSARPSRRILEQEHGWKKDWAVTVPLDRLEEAERAKDRFTNLLVPDRLASRCWSAASAS